MKTRKIYIAILFYCVICMNNTEAQINLINASTLDDKNIEINKGSHQSAGIEFGEKDEVVNYFRIMKFWIRFNGDANNTTGCAYDIKDEDQPDWNKVMKISTDQCNETKNSIRLGWRWNLNTKKMEVGLYAHLNHLEEHVQVGCGDRPGREFFQLASLELNGFYEVEMVLCKYGVMVKVGGAAGYILRDIFSWDPDNGENTDFKRNAFFGGQQDAPHDMDMDVEQIEVDDASYLSIKSRMTCFLGDMFFCNTVFTPAPTFGNTEKFSAVNNIIAPVPPEIPAQQEELPYTAPFFIIEPGMSITFTAGNKIILQNGFHAKPGSSFHAYQDPSCNPARYAANQTESEESVIIKDNSSSENNSDLSGILLSKKLYLIYPNPTTGIFNVYFPTPKDDDAVKISIINALGQTIQEITSTHSSVQMEISSHPKGIYFLKVQSRENIYTHKLIFSAE